MTNRRASFASAASTRRKPPPSEVVGLQYTSLEKLLGQTLVEYCEDRNLRVSARHQFRGLALRHEGTGSRKNNATPSHMTREELESIVNTLSEILDQSPRLPPQHVACIHTYIGLANNLNGQYESAVTSFLKALWLETSTTHESDHVEIGLCLHRLGISYNKCGDKDSAYNLLGKALKVYEVSGLSRDHPFVTHAREEQDIVRNELSKRKRPWQSTPNLKVLPTIDEDGATNGGRRHTFNFERAVTTRLTSV